jgi:hypothetical protein
VPTCDSCSPFSEYHNNYIRSYLSTGKAQVLNKVNKFVALHKERHIIPVSFTVSKVSGIGEDTMFMGVIEVGRFHHHVLKGPPVMRVLSVLGFAAQDCWVATIVDSMASALSAGNATPRRHSEHLGPVQWPAGGNRPQLL